MSWTVEQWVAVLTIAFSTLTWSVSGLIRAWTYRREQQQKEWLRLAELLAVLYNKQHEHGHWAQLAAINEMRTLTANRPAVLRIARQIREFWAKGDHQDVVDELDRLLRGDK